MGKQEYEINCVACHGAGGKGDGYFARFMNLKLPDLTTISERNGGVFPADRVREIIDGQQALKGHGPRQMPIWGNNYTERAAEYCKGFAYDPEAFVNVRIVALIDYLYQLQTRR
jgi:mono/diheme cytochrome c family protein